MPVLQAAALCLLILLNGSGEAPVPESALLHDDSHVQRKGRPSGNNR